jgi:hypothetical protein
MALAFLTVFKIIHFTSTSFYLHYKYASFHFFLTVNNEFIVTYICHFSRQTRTKPLCKKQSDEKNHGPLTATMGLFIHYRIINGLPARQQRPYGHLQTLL